MVPSLPTMLWNLSVHCLWWSASSHHRLAYYLYLYSPASGRQIQQNIKCKSKEKSIYQLTTQMQQSNYSVTRYDDLQWIVTQILRLNWQQYCDTRQIKVMFIIIIMPLTVVQPSPMPSFDITYLVRLVGIVGCIVDARRRPHCFTSDNARLRRLAYSDRAEATPVNLTFLRLSQLVR